MEIALILRHDEMVITRVSFLENFMQRGLWLLIAGLLLSRGVVPADEPAQPKIVPLNPNGTVLADYTNKKLLLKGKVVLREGTLEMFACLKQTKEHESIVSIDTKAYVVHSGLLVIGTKQGKPVEFMPKFSPPEGQKIDIYMTWTDKQGNPQRRKVQELMRSVTNRYYGHPLASIPDGIVIPDDTELRYDPRHKELSWYGIMKEAERDRFLKLSQNAEWTKAINYFYKTSQVKPMNAQFVFAGSILEKLENGEEFYHAEGGELICVANFAAATIDVAQESTAEGAENLLFEAWTERLPPIDTPITLELIPVKEEKKP